MNVLVTGGAGYIGSHTCKALRHAGLMPITYDNLIHGHENAVRFGPFVRGDIHDSAKLVSTLQQYHVDAVIHFAAFAYVGESVRRPGLYYRNNVAGSLSLLEAMGQANVHQLVFSSTCAVYGAPQQVPLTEAHPLAPLSPYGNTKRVVEQMLQDFSCANHLASISLRYFNAAGASFDGDLGENHTPETHLIPLALQAASGGAPLTIFGTDYPTDDGTCVRDYIHVTDLAQAHVLALQRLQSGAKGASVYNLGVGKGFSVRDVMAVVRQICGLDVQHTLGPRRAGDPAILVADASLARQELGWKPHHDGLEEIVQTAWRWHQSLPKNSV